MKKYIIKLLKELFHIKIIMYVIYLIGLITADELILG